MLLETEELNVSYGSTQVLWDVSIEVGADEIVGIIGRNGAGKTTLIRAIIGQLEADSGTIRYKDTDVTTLTPHEHARLGMGYIPQGREIFPNLTVEQNLKVGEEINDETDDMLYDVIYDYFPVLEERNRQKAGTMSGGEQQMLAIARAIVGNPDFLLLDEPSEGIQPSIVQQITDRIYDINRELDITILFVEQNLSVIQDLGSRCYVLKRGRVDEILSEEEIQDEERMREHLAV